MCDVQTYDATMTRKMLTKLCSCHSFSLSWQPLPSRRYSLRISRFWFCSRTVAPTPSTRLWAPCRLTLTYPVSATAGWICEWSGISVVHINITYLLYFSRMLAAPAAQRLCHAVLSSIDFLPMMPCPLVMLSMYCILGRPLFLFPGMILRMRLNNIMPIVSTSMSKKTIFLFIIWAKSLRLVWNSSNKLLFVVFSVQLICSILRLHHLSCRLLCVHSYIHTVCCPFSHTILIKGWGWCVFPLLLWFNGYLHLCLNRPVSSLPRDAPDGLALKILKGYHDNNPPSTPSLSIVDYQKVYLRIQYVVPCVSFQMFSHYHNTIRRFS